MFTAQGAALNTVASRNVEVLVVGSSANTNDDIASSSCRWSAYFCDGDADGKLWRVATTRHQLCGATRGDHGTVTRAAVLCRTCRST